MIFLIHQHLLLFDHQVWLGLGISIVCVITVLNLIRRYLEYRSLIETPSSPIDNPATGKLITEGETGKQYVYVFGTLLSQGLKQGNQMTHFAS
jgi:hypothetical protein